MKLDEAFYRYADEIADTITPEAVAEVAERLIAEGLIVRHNKFYRLTVRGSALARQHDFPDTEDGITAFIVHLIVRRKQQAEINRRLVRR
jgi:predicted transcriptional regulator